MPPAETTRNSGGGTSTIPTDKWWHMRLSEYCAGGSLGGLWRARDAPARKVRRSSTSGIVLAVTTLADILLSSQNPVSAAMLLVLSWVASSDGEITQEEMEGLHSIAESGKESAELRSVIDLVQRRRVTDFQLACEILRELEPKHRRLMLQMSIGMALEDGYLTTAEGHILRFIADVLSQPPRDLDDLFREMTGHSFPTPADPSSIEWWEARESRAEQTSQANREEPNTQTQGATATPDLRRLRDLGILGLDENATIVHIKDAYRRMAQIHHPDKFVTLGPEAVKAAEVTFLRIRAAYERLAPP